MNEIRLQKFIADAGVASRRHAEEIIRQGRVKVDGRTVTEMGFKVTEASKVEIDGKLISIEKKKRYIMLNKPEGFITTANDQFGRPTVLDLVKGIKERVYPVGRLEYDTSGLLLLTNDGSFAYKLTHPRHEVKKVYIAEVIGIPDEKSLKTFREGIYIDGYKTSPADIRVLEKKNNKSILEITIHEGKNRQVRKMCDAIGHPVVKLKRIAIGKLSLGNLEAGKWRELTKKEIEELNKLTKLN